MLVHAPSQFEPGEIISSVELGFSEFEQKFEMVCALSFSSLSGFRHQNDEVFLYFKLFGKGILDYNKYEDCGSLEALFTSLAKSFLHNRSHDNFECSDHGGLIVIPEKNTTKSYVLEFLCRRRINDESHEEVSSKIPMHEVPRIFGTPTIIQKCDINEAKGNISASLREILHNAYECHRQHADKKGTFSHFITIPWNLLATLTCVSTSTQKITNSR